MLENSIARLLTGGLATHLDKRTRVRRGSCFGRRSEGKDAGLEPRSSVGRHAAHVKPTGMYRPRALFVLAAMTNA